MVAQDLEEGSVSKADRLVLSREELAALCRTPQRARQVAFLRSNGIRHYVDAHGWPVVLRSTLESEPAPAEQARGWKSNKAA